MADSASLEDSSMELRDIAESAERGSEERRCIRSETSDTQDGEAETEGQREITLLGLRATKKPFIKVMTAVLLNWLLTAVVAASIYVVLAVYESKPVMSKTGKRGFNAIITGLSICLGLTIASSLDEMVGDLRWWILSRKYRSPRKVNLILQSDRIRHILMLAFGSRRMTVHFAVWAWVGIILASQIGVASIGLCYSVDPSDRKARLVSGNVTLPNLQTVETVKFTSTKSQSFSAQQYTANSFGTIALAYNIGTFDQLPKAGSLWFQDDPLIFCEESCMYVCHETSTESVFDPNMSLVTVVTNRRVNSSATCQSWHVIRGGAGITTTIAINTTVGERNLTMPVARGTGQTIYMTNTTETCGPGCSMVSAFEASVSSPWYYKCNISVTQASKITRPEHKLGSNLTTMASAGIALQGYDASSLINDTRFQYQIYPAESIYGTPANGSNQVLETILSLFSIGVVAVAGESNSNYFIMGLTPEVGVQLNISHMNLIIMILILVAGIQLALGIAVAVIAHRVVVPKNGPIAVSSVCRAMRHASQLEAERHLAASSSMKSYRKTMWIYCDTLIADGFFDLHMEEESHPNVENTEEVGSSEYLEN